MLVYELFECPT